MNWLQTALKEARVKKVVRKSFFSSRHDADVHLLLLTYADGTVLGGVTTGEERLYFGRNAEYFFNDLHASEEAHYAIMRAQVRAIGNGRLPHEDADRSH